MSCGVSSMFSDGTASMPIASPRRRKSKMPQPLDSYGYQKPRVTGRVTGSPIIVLHL